MKDDFFDMYAVFSHPDLEHQIPDPRLRREENTAVLCQYGKNWLVTVSHQIADYIE